AAFKVKEPEFEGKKHESEVHVSPSSKFDDFSDNSINEVNDVDSPVPAVGQILTNSTNTFSAASPSNTAVTLEDITYSDNKEDVGAKADFTNLETNITLSPIPTTRVHKDHHVTQIIGDLSSATQKRIMTRVVKDQGGLTQIIMKTSIHACLPAFYHKKNLRGYIKLLKNQVRLKLCRRIYFNSRCKRFGS
nr:hypothetical protein [Tanacetum cinerariifolium]